MAETLSGVNGEILRWAREFYNMNAEDAAKAIGVDVERYCNWEAGTDHPTYAKLRKISEVFRKPSAVFFFPTPPQLPPIRVICVHCQMMLSTALAKILLFNLKRLKSIK